MKTIRIKICGITRLSDAQLAVQLGAWALGFIFYGKSTRYISPDAARRIIKSLPPFIVPVGVFVNQSETQIKKIAGNCGIHTLQFHGDESVTFCRRFRNFKLIKAFRIGVNKIPSSIRQYDVDAILFDTFLGQNIYGGTGVAFDWRLIKKIKGDNKRVILSGGINPSNVQKAIQQFKPYAVDVNSGVEQSPGVKSTFKLRQLFKRIAG